MKQGVAWLGFVHRLDSGWQFILARRLDSVLAEAAPATFARPHLLVGLILLITGGIGLGLAMRFACSAGRAADDQLHQARDDLERRVAMKRTAQLSASQARLQKAHDFYLTVLEHFPALIWRAGLDAKCNYFNATWLQFTGRSLDQEMGDGWTSGIHADDSAGLPQHLHGTASRRTSLLPWNTACAGMMANIAGYSTSGRPFNNLAGEFAGYLGACFDVTERHEVGRATGSDRHRLYAMPVKASPSPTRKAPSSTSTRHSAKLPATQREEVIGRTPSLLKSEHQSPEFYTAMWAVLIADGHWHGEIWNRKKSGELYAELLTISAVRNEAGDVRHYVGIFADITVQKEHERHLEKLAHFDPLTELPNRTLLNDRLYMSIALASRNKTMLAVCLLDLDGFKSVNDTYGHAAGDELLIEFSRRALAIMRDTDTLSRLGGDEFVLLLNDLDNLEQGLEIIRRVLEAASHSYDIAGEPVHVSASVGVTLFPDDGVEPELLMRHADQAMYIAKQTGRNRYFLFDPMKDEAARAELADLQRLEKPWMPASSNCTTNPRSTCNAAWSPGRKR
jgi:diguanylate cyclase (GGDEF)-like protein